MDALTLEACEHPLRVRICRGVPVDLTHFPDAPLPMYVEYNTVDGDIHIFSFADGLFGFGAGCKTEFGGNISKGPHGRERLQPGQACILLGGIYGSVHIAGATAGDKVIGYRIAAIGRIGGAF